METSFVGYGDKKMYDAGDGPGLSALGNEAMMNFGLDLIASLILYLIYYEYINIFQY